jgi:hypothetical protein
MNVSSRHAPDTVFVRCPANPKAGYRISGKAGYLMYGRIFGYNYISRKISNKFKNKL